jgi:hypothetical protein
MRGERGLFEELIGDGRPALSLMAAGLLFSGAFAIFLAFRREFLPHDVSFLGMTAAELCALADCRIVGFMFHDRVSFGGTLIACALLYLWLAAFPLRAGAAWAWHAFAVSGAVGFGSFLTYLGYGYLDVWHGAASFVLLLAFITGLWKSRTFARVPAVGWLRTVEGRRAPLAVKAGRIGLLTTGGGLVAAGLVISYIGVTDVFVTTDLAFMGVTREALDAVNTRLVPLIAHDRAGFGGGLTTVGTLFAMCGWYARPGRAFHQAVVLAGIAGFGAGIGTHFAEGYMNPMHLAPAFAGAALFACSIAAEIAGTRQAATVAPVDRLATPHM